MPNDNSNELVPAGTVNSNGVSPATTAIQEVTPAAANDVPEANNAAQTTQANSSMYIMLFAVVLYFALRSYLPRLLNRKVKFMKAAQISQKLEAGEEMLIIDIRAQNAVTRFPQSLQGAIHLPVQEAMSRIPSLKEKFDGYLDTPILVICQSNTIAPKIASMFAKAGFSDVSVLLGGINMWNRLRLPVMPITPFGFNADDDLDDMEGEDIIEDIEDTEFNDMSEAVDEVEENTAEIIEEIDTTEPTKDENA